MSAIYEVTWQTDNSGDCYSGSHMNSTTVHDCLTIDIMGLEEDSLYTITGTVSNSAAIVLRPLMSLQRQVGWGRTGHPYIESIYRRYDRMAKAI